MCRRVCVCVCVCVCVYSVQYMCICENNRDVFMSYIHVNGVGCDCFVCKYLIKIGGREVERKRENVCKCERE